MILTKPTDITDMKKAYRTRNEGEFPETLTIILKKDWDLKYGENPNQQAAIYALETINEQNANKISELTNLETVRSDGKGKGGLSGNNTMDITRGMDTLKYFTDVPAVAILKHVTISGFAKQTNKQTLSELFRSARDADIRSNFGGTVVVNQPLNMETAKAMYELKGQSPFFVDVIAAPGYEEGVIEYIESQSAGIRIGEFSNINCLPKYIGDDTKNLLSIKEMPTGRLMLQDIYLTSIKNTEDFILQPKVVDKNGEEHILKTIPTTQQLDDCLTAWYLNITGARSNGIVIVNEGKSIAIGSGQVERVGAIEQAIVKGMQKAMDREGIKYNPLYGISKYEQISQNPFENAVVSSDAFFPFGDSIELLAKVGVKTAIQPYGSIRDSQVIDTMNKYNMSGPATLERCFGHF